MAKFVDWASNVSISCVGGWGSVVSTEVDLFKVLGSLGGGGLTLREAGIRLHEPSP